MIDAPTLHSLASTLTQIEIDVSMWRNLVWDWQKYFGKSTCVGSPASMRQDAELCGQHHHQSQASASGCLVYAAATPRCVMLCCRSN
ncbi:hypothetical protein SAMN06265222_1011024 [Neorhodopirellula lusitana]|uniref:Uncharacterized protein n=1 Tax=Neorhodopirellula lusitana TaxID=445327 RepID=A0ABY1PRV5_9BACT|nr:hypothetical protein SAMN06265222_1011024 [Neorhodopirellula lusitana]